MRLLRWIRLRLLRLLGGVSAEDFVAATLKSARLAQSVRVARAEADKWHEQYRAWTEALRVTRRVCFVPMIGLPITADGKRNRAAIISVIQHRVAVNIADDIRMDELTDDHWAILAADCAHELLGACEKIAEEVLAELRKPARIFADG